MTIRATIGLKTKEHTAYFSGDSLDEIVAKIRRKYRTCIYLYLHVEF